MPCQYISPNQLIFKKRKNGYQLYVDVYDFRFDTEYFLFAKTEGLRGGIVLLMCIFHSHCYVCSSSSAQK